MSFDQPGGAASTHAARRDRSGRSWRLLRAHRVPLAVLAAVFVVSRAAYAAAGVRFDAEPRDYLYQLVDPQVLTDRYAESLWYLHSQPPGFNAFVGAVLRWSPLPDGASFQIAYLLLGALLTLATYALARTLGARAWPAVTIAVVVSANPTTVLYENWLSYEYPVAVALVAVCVCAARWARTGATSWLALTVALGAACVLTRSLVHPLWLLAVIAIVLAARRPARWTPAVLAALALPVLVVGGVMVKNQVLFDTPQLSSWFGWNLHKMAVDPLPADVRERLRDDGVLRAEPVARPCELERPGVPVLAERLKRAERGEAGFVNYHWECLIDWHDDLEADAWAAIRAEPGLVARNVAGSAELWATPASLYFSLVENRDQIAVADETYRRVVLLDVAWEPPIEVDAGWVVQLSAPDERFHLSITIVLATLVVLAAGAVVTVRWVRRRGGLSPAEVALLVAAGTVAFVTVSSILFEHGENHRIRWIAEPLTLTVAASVVVVTVGRWRGARDDRGDGPSSAQSPVETST